MVSTNSQLLNQQQKNKRVIKCVVWDLDNTLWNGTLLEDEQVHLRESVIEIIKVLDSRGILQSIASKNDYDVAMDKLKEFGLQDYFIYPQINWDSKVISLEKIAKSINISLDTIAFIDDRLFELEEVNFSLPSILCINASDTANILDLPEMYPRFITEDSRNRRLMYISDIQRQEAEENFVGTSEDFLATLQMKLTLSLAQEEDLQRAEELTVRTNQLNTTGYTYSYDELNYFRQSENYKLLIASLEDKYGTYGKIGLSLIECQKDFWTIKLLLMSCRVMSRGIGTVMLNFLMKLAKENNVRLLAEFISNNRNRMMYISYKFAGFKEIDRKDNLITFENKLENIQSFPKYMNIEFLS
ncbi:FkbH like protein [Calothrix parasitica NIES-267]|uniref:FkbH like protein n=1 Tax=Calothrix parasitica NIES-267 TaxID=1973488 RepID=A0A1Z4LTB1_9CYAN|nr:FkbH like protein [Calothrix parasitica NIES-267]